MKNARNTQPTWPRLVLLAAATYHIAWGVLLIAMPSTALGWFGLPAAEAPAAWQSLGIFTATLGAGFGIASLEPVRHWLLVSVALVCKVLIAAGFAISAVQSALPWSLGIEVLLTDVLWWLPFAAVLYHAWNRHADTTISAEELAWDAALNKHVSQRGATLMSLSEKRNLLVAFIRHSGCTFCREMLSDLSEQRARLEAHGMEIAVVHMSPPLEAAQLAIRYGLEGVHLFSDPQCELYEAFGLERGSVTQLFGPKVWVRGFWAGLVEGHGLGLMQGDGFRLQGAFILRRGEILVGCRAQTAADPMDFVSLSKAARRMNGDSAKATQSAAS